MATTAPTPPAIPAPGPGKRPRKRWRWWVIGAVLLVPTLLLSLVLVRNPLARWIAWKALNSRLAVPVELDAITIAPWDGTVTLEGLRLAQPDPQGGDPVLALGRLHLAVSYRTLLGRDPVFPELRISDLRLRIIRQADGTWAPQGLLRPVSPSAPTTSTPAPSPTVASAESAQDARRLHLSRIVLERLSVVIEDRIGGGTWIARLGNLEVTVDDLLLATGRWEDSTWQQVRLALGPLSLPAAPAGGPLLDLESLSVHLGAGTAGSGPITVEKIQVDGLALALDRPRQGPDSLTATIAHLLRGGQPMAPVTPVAPVPGQAVVATPPRPIHLVAAEVNRASLALTDARVADKPWPVLIQELQVRVGGVWLHRPADLPPTDATCALDGLLAQPGSPAPARYALRGRFDAGTPAPVPNGRFRIQITGLALDTLDPLVPGGTRTLLGGDAVDLGIRAVTTPDHLTVDAELRTDRGRLYPTTLSGPPEELDLSIAPLVTAILRRTGEGLLASGASAVKAGTATLAGAGSAVASAGKGLLSAGASVGSGLFKSLAGVVTLDRDRIAEGLGTATSGAADSLAKGAVDSKSALVGGIQRSREALTGSKAQDAWWKAMADRHDQILRQAQADAEGHGDTQAPLTAAPVVGMVAP